jgi:hypothetical protein
MIETTELNEIKSILKIEKLSLIGIDGKDGSGKTTLASQLANDLGYCHINLDCKLDKNRGNFVENIRYDLLQSELEVSQEPIIIEGVCLLAVLKKLDMRLDKLIYVKLMNVNGKWDDEKECDVQGDVDEFVAGLKDEFQNFMKELARVKGKEFDPAEGVIPELEEEVIRYHHKYKPHMNADIIYNCLTDN